MHKEKQKKKLSGHRHQSVKKTNRHPSRQPHPCRDWNLNSRDAEHSPEEKQLLSLGASEINTQLCVWAARISHRAGIFHFGKRWSPHLQLYNKHRQHKPANSISEEEKEMKETNEIKFVGAARRTCNGRKTMKFPYDLG